MLRLIEPEMRPASCTFLEKSKTRIGGMYRYLTILHGKGLFKMKKVKISCE